MQTFLTYLFLYLMVGFVVAYLVMAFNPKFNRGRDVNLDTAWRVFAVGAIFWPLFLGLWFYQAWIEDNTWLGGKADKIVIKFRGKKS